MKNRFTGHLGRLFFKAVTLERRSPGSVVTNKRNTTDAGTLRAARHSSMTLCNEQRGGFTLIELLVVVLIIGILSAVALPQYQKAVARSRAAEAMTNGTALVQALDRYYMANGVYTGAEVTDLDIQFPESKYYNYNVYNTGNSSTRVQVVPKMGGLPSFEWSLEGQRARWCFAPVSDEQANAACATYGTYSHTWDNSHKYYKLN